MKRFKFPLLALLIAELACVALFAYDAYTFHEQGAVSYTHLTLPTT